MARNPKPSPRTPPKPLLDAEDQRLLNEMLDQGRTHAEILRDLHEAGIMVAASTLQKYRRRYLDSKEEGAKPEPSKPAGGLTAGLRAGMAARRDAAAAAPPPAPMDAS